MSEWEEIEEAIVEILNSEDAVSYNEKKREHHYGNPFLTAHQIALLLKEKFNHLKGIASRNVGGEGEGNRTIAWYIADQLSKKIKKQKNTGRIEGAFLSQTHFSALAFDKDNVKPTIVNNGNPLSMFRLREIKNIEK